MSLRIVQSKQNSRLKELRRVVAHAGREDRGLAAIEGRNLVAEAMRAGLRMECVFVAQGFEALAVELNLAPELDVLAVPREVLDQALDTETPQPIAALVAPPDWTFEHILGARVTGAGRRSAPLVVVLAGLQDPGNLGTILRSAEAFGASGVVALPGTVSAWNPKAVRASAGSVFRMPLVAMSAEECFSKLREAGVKILTTAANGLAMADQVDLALPVAFIIGNEGNGVPRALTEMADGGLAIPCPGPVESLNAAVAASVLLYEASRQRSTRRGDTLLRAGGSR